MNRCGQITYTRDVGTASKTTPLVDPLTDTQCAQLFDQPLVVVVPIKSFTTAKSRLNTVMSRSSRSLLAQYLAERVLEMLRDFPTIVMCDDVDVAALATKCGAVAAMVHEPGLNTAIDAARSVLRHANVTTMAIVHSDIMDPDDLPTVLQHITERATVAPGVTIVPDRHESGTNILAVPVATDFPFAYGHDSFHAHSQAANALSLPIEVIRHVRLGWDVDDGDDLSALPHDLRSQLTMVGEQ